MEARLNDTAALADAGERIAQYKDMLAECLFGGGDVTRLTQMVLHLVERDQPDEPDAEETQLSLAAQMHRVAQESTRVPAGSDRGLWTISWCATKVGLDGGRLTARRVSRRKDAVGEMDLAVLEAIPAIVDALGLRAGSAAARAAGGPAAGEGAEDADAGGLSVRALHQRCAYKPIPRVLCEIQLEGE